MRILMVTSSYPLYPGDGTAPFIESIVQALISRGHEIDLVLPDHVEFRPIETTRLRFFPYRYTPTDRLSVWGYARSLEGDTRIRALTYLVAPLAILALRRRVRKLLRGGEYDVVHAHWVVPNAAAIFDVVRKHGRPLVLSVHGSDVFLAERSGLARMLARRAFRSAASVTACSNDLHRRAVALGAPPSKTLTVPYGVDAEVFVGRKSTARIRRQLGAPDASFLVLAAGRLVEKKGFGYLVEAAAQLDGAHVVIVGEGDLRAELQNRVAALGAPVRLVGSLDRRSMSLALSAADVLVVPSVVDSAGNVDGLPNVLLESLASGRPVVASRVGGIPDVLENGRNGLLVPQRDSAALAAALRRLMAEPETRHRLAKEARRTAIEELTWDATASLFESCFAEALDRSAAVQTHERSPRPEARRGAGTGGSGSA